MIIPSMYVLAASVVFVSISLMIIGIKKYLVIDDNYDYSLKETFMEEDEIVPVVNTATEIIRPYLADNVTIGKYFYDFEATEEKQESALILYENTYMQNSGVDYVSETPFDVLSVLDGEVIKVETDSTLGNIVKIQHENDFISVYQGIDNVTLKEGSKIAQGEIIGTSGTSKLNSDYTTSLHFEIYYKGAMMDPENFYTINLQEIEQ